MSTRGGLKMPISSPGSVWGQGHQGAMATLRTIGAGLWSWAGHALQAPHPKQDPHGAPPSACCPGVHSAFLGTSRFAGARSPREQKTLVSRPHA